MAAERKRIHLDRRRVGNLHQRDAIGRQSAHRRDRIAAHAGVETVQDDAEIGAVGLAHDIPGRRPILDAPPPGERLVADAESVLMRRIGEFGEVLRGAMGIVDRLGRDVGAQAEQPRPQFVHQVELAGGALEIARADRIGHCFEVAHRLQSSDFQPEVGRHRARVARLAAEERQVILEDLDSAKPSLRSRGELGLQGAAHADGGDRPSKHLKNLLDLSFNSV